MLLERNKEHLGQAVGTPVTKEMLESIPVTADSGNDIEGPTWEATQILKHCRRRAEEDEEEIKIEEIRYGFRRVDERMSTSLSRLHLDKFLVEQEEEKTYLLKTITAVINCALTKGITWERWCSVHNVLLEKDPNDPILLRLRIIHIIDSNYNSATKIHWDRRLLQTAERERGYFMMQTGGQEKGGQHRIWQW